MDINLPFRGGGASNAGYSREHFFSRTHTLSRDCTPTSRTDPRPSIYARGAASVSSANGEAWGLQETVQAYWFRVRNVLNMRREHPLSHPNGSQICGLFTLHSQQQATRALYCIRACAATHRQSVRGTRRGWAPCGGMQTAVSVQEA